MKKIASLAVVLLLVAGVFGATTASAQSVADLQAMITKLQQELAALGGKTTTGASTFTKTLTVGSRGAEVSALQEVLNTEVDAGLPVTGYFGPKTKAAVIKFQKENGISGTGTVGPLTRAALNALQTPADNGNTGTSTDNGNTGNTGSNLQGGAGDITVTERSSGVKDEVLEGDKDAKVLGMDVKADGSDIAVSSVKVNFKMTGAGSTRLDRYVDEVVIMLDNNVVGTADVKDFSKSGTDYSRSIPVTGVTIKDGETGRLYVAVNAVNNIDSTDLGKNWTVTYQQARFQDATGAILTDITSNINEVFSFKDLATSGDVTLTVSEADAAVNDPRKVAVSATSDTNGVALMSFKLKAQGSDISLTSIPFTLTSSGAGVTEMINDLRLKMNGTEVGTIALDTASDSTTGFASSSDTQRTLTVSNLDDDNVVIKDGQTVTFTLEADINDTEAGFSNGDAIVVALADDTISAENANGDTLSATALKGAVTTEGTSFGSTGIMISKGDADTSSLRNNVADNSTDDQGVFVINFDVTAFEDPAYIALTGSSSKAASTTAAGVMAYVESTNANDTMITSGTTTVIVEMISGGTLSGNYVKIEEGQTAKMRATIYHDIATTGTVRGQLHAVNFATTAVAGDTQELALPTSDFQSSSEQILN